MIQLNKTKTIDKANPRQLNTKPTQPIETIKPSYHSLYHERSSSPLIRTWAPTVTNKSAHLYDNKALCDESATKGHKASGSLCACERPITNCIRRRVKRPSGWTPAWEVPKLLLCSSKVSTLSFNSRGTFGFFVVWKVFFTKMVFLYEPVGIKAYKNKTLG